jgi:DNA-binding XRE family transcriptional regulator
MSGGMAQEEANQRVLLANAAFGEDSGGPLELAELKGSVLQHKDWPVGRPEREEGEPDPDTDLAAWNEWRARQHEKRWTIEYHGKVVPAVYIDGVKLPVNCAPEDLSKFSVREEKDLSTYSVPTYSRQHITAYRNKLSRAMGLGMLTGVRADKVRRLLKFFDVLLEAMQLGIKLTQRCLAGLADVSQKTISNYLSLLAAHGLVRICAGGGIEALVPGKPRIPRKKRGGAAQHITLAESAAVPQRDMNLLALDDALIKLETIDPDKSRMVELRFFSGLSVEETAEVMGVSPRTIDRQWQTAKAWLHREISAEKAA